MLDARRRSGRALRPLDRRDVVLTGWPSGRLDTRRPDGTICPTRSPAAHAPIGIQEEAMTTRRDFLTITVLGGAAAAMTPSRVGAAPKSMTVARESSFIKPFDDYFSQKLAAE